MEKLKNSKYAIISFVFAIIPIIVAVFTAILDIAKPNPSNFQPAVAYFIMNFMFLLSLIGLILGIIGVKQKGYKIKLAVSSIILSGLVLLIPITTYSLLFIKIFIR